MKGRALIQLILAAKLEDKDFKVVGTNASGIINPAIAFKVEEIAPLINEENEEEFVGIVVNTEIE